MPARSARPLALTVFTALFVAVGGACSQQQQAPATASPAPPTAPEGNVEPLKGRMPPFCASCGTVIAINRVEAAPQPRLPGSAPSAARPGGERFEVVIRLNAGTQQIILLDETPQLSIGQRVRITDGIIVPDLG